MPQKPDFTLTFSLQNIEDFSLDAIARSPRNFRPGDLVNACNNVVISWVDKEPPPHIVAIAKYIVVDFFALAHGSGLYNRQSKLWEALAKVASAQVFFVRKGFLQKEVLPEFDMILLDHKGRALLAVHYDAPVAASVGTHDYMRSFKEFLKRTKLRQGIAGLILCYPAPFPENVRNFVSKETNATDPVQRYESVLPALNVAIDLMEVDSAVAAKPNVERQSQYAVRLVHPDLTKKKSWSGTRVRGANVDLDESLTEPENEIPGSM